MGEFCPMAIDKPKAQWQRRLVAKAEEAFYRRCGTDGAPWRVC